MRSHLTKRQDKFISEYAISHNATKAALKAGYASSSAYQRGYELVNNSDIRQRLAVLGVVGLDTLQDIARNGKNELARVAAGRTLVEYGISKQVNSTQLRSEMIINIKKI